MPTIYPTNATYVIPAGGTVSAATFASAGTYAVQATYTSDNTATYKPITISWSGGNTPNINAGGTSLNVDKLIEALFRLNPAAREKYEGDKSKFAAALIAAGDAAEGKRALSDLTDLGFTK